MTFINQVLPSLAGTFFGFVFAVFLFIITNKLKSYHEKKTLLKHLKREFEYDISLLQEWIEEIDKIIRKITANDRQVFSYIRYTFFQRFFMQKAFQSGIMYDGLNDEHIYKLNDILLHCDTGFEQYINGVIQQWKENQLPQQKALQIFEFEKDNLQKYRKNLLEILGYLSK